MFRAVTGHCARSTHCHESMEAGAWPEKAVTLERTGTKGRFSLEISTPAATFPQHPRSAAQPPHPGMSTCMGTMLYVPVAFYWAFLFGLHSNPGGQTEETEPQIKKVREWQNGDL